MRFFSRIVFICNLCFLLAILLRFFELAGKADRNTTNGLIPYQPLESTIATLGLIIAVLLNFIFVALCCYWIPAGRIKQIPRWIVLFNLLVFPLQVYYHFFSR